jgi:hypothetical protein
MFEAVLLPSDVAEWACPGLSAVPRVPCGSLLLLPWPAGVGSQEIVCGVCGFAGLALRPRWSVRRRLAVAAADARFLAGPRVARPW